MNKYVAMFLCLLLLLLVLAGCRNPQDTHTTNGTRDSWGTHTIDGTESLQTTGTPIDLPEGVCIPTTDQDYWELLCENCDMTFYLDSSGQRFVGFYLLSTRNLEGETISIITDLGGNTEYSIPKAITDAFVFPMSAFLAYQNVDWGKLADDPTAAEMEIAQWETAYRQLLPALPKLYVYNIQWSFEELGVQRDDPAPIQQIRSLTVSINGYEKTYNPGTFIFDAGKYNVNATYLGGLSNNFFGASEYPVDPSADGVVKLPEWSIRVKKDVVLESISVVDCEAIEVIKCELAIRTPQGDVFSFLWDANSSIEIDEGSEITLKVTLADPCVAGKLIGNIMRYVVLNYTSDGESYGAVITMHCRIAASPHDIYALKIDGVDMIPYYVDYYNPLYQGD